MNLTLCGSIAFINEMDALRQELEALGHTVKMPPMQERIGENGEHISAEEYYAHKKAAGTDLNHWIWKHHGDCITTHFQKVEWADAVVILNLDKILCEVADQYSPPRINFLEWEEVFTKRSLANIIQHFVVMAITH